MAALVIDGAKGTMGPGRGGSDARRYRRRVWAIAVMLIVVLIGAAALRWFMTSAEVFDEVLVPSGLQVDLPPGTTSSWSGRSDLPAVKVNSAEVLLSSSSGPATASASVCLGFGGFGGVWGDLAQHCNDVMPLAGTDLSEVPESAFLVISVAPLTTAEVQVVGLRVAFEDRWRSGEQTIPADLRFFPSQP